MAKQIQKERGMKLFSKTEETMSRNKRLAARKAQLLRIFRYACAKAPGYKQFLKNKGIDPKSIRTMKDFEKLPVLKKHAVPEMHMKNPPFGGLLAVPVEKLRRIYVSPGTIYDPEGRIKDYWGLTRALVSVGFRPGDIVMNTFSYHLTPAGHMLDEACQCIGCVSVPTGIGNTEIQAKTMAELKINGYIGIPSFLLTLLKKAEGMGYVIGKDIVMQVAAVSGEKLTTELRKSLNDYGVIVRQMYITADIGGIAYECHKQNGMHISDKLHVEICDPDTGTPLPFGAMGEIVVTHHSNKIYPLVRYGTGDLSIMDEARCSCGRTSYTLRGIFGRADEVTKIKGMFVHPRQIDDVAAAFPAEIERIRLVVSKTGHNDIMTAEIVLKHGIVATDELKEKIAEQVQRSTKLRGDVVFVDVIPDNAKKIEDTRKWE